MWEKKNRKIKYEGLYKTFPGRCVTTTVPQTSTDILISAPNLYVGELHVQKRGPK